MFSRRKRRRKMSVLFRDLNPGFQLYLQMEAQQTGLPEIVGCSPVHFGRGPVLVRDIQKKVRETALPHGLGQIVERSGLPPEVELSEEGRQLITTARDWMTVYFPDAVVASGS
jgi:hypothetical protein